MNEKRWDIRKNIEKGDTNWVKNKKEAGIVFFRSFTFFISFCAFGSKRKKSVSLFALSSPTFVFARTRQNVCRAIFLFSE